jgi:hypothetical protein
MASRKDRSHAFVWNVRDCLLSTWRRLVVRLPALHGSTNNERASELAALLG